jgi:hypothetical protein
MKKFLLLALSLTCGMIYSQNSVSYAPGSTLDVSINPGYTKTVNINYNVTTSNFISLALNIRDVNGGYKSTPYSVSIDNIALPSGDKSGTLTVEIPSNFPLSSTLTNGDFYQWNLTMLTFPGFGYVGEAPAIGPVTVQAALGTIDYSIASSEMFVSNSSKSLNVDASNLKAGSLRIVDMTGREVKSIKNLKASASHDLSGLRSGVYVAVTDDNRKLKFAL